MGNPGETSDRAKPDLRKALALHREMNPVAGCPVIVGMDAASGQLFFLARKGSCLRRDNVAVASGADRLYVEWQRTRQSR